MIQAILILLLLLILFFEKINRGFNKLVNIIIIIMKRFIKLAYKIFYIAEIYYYSRSHI
jgi:hypothetical protein